MYTRKSEKVSAFSAIVRVFDKYWQLLYNYSETCLKRSPSGPIFLSALDRCPLQTGYIYDTLTSKLVFLDNIFCPRQAFCPLQTGFTVLFYCCSGQISVMRADRQIVRLFIGFFPTISSLFPLQSLKSQRKMISIIKFITELNKQAFAKRFLKSDS